MKKYVIISFIIYFFILPCLYSKHTPISPYTETDSFPVIRSKSNSSGDLGKNSWLTGTAFSRNGKFLYVCDFYRDKVFILKVKGNKCRRRGTLKHNFSVPDCIVQGIGKRDLFLGDLDYLYLIRGKKVIKRAKLLQGANAIAITKDGNYAAVLLSGGFIEVFDLRSWYRLKFGNAGGYQTYGLAFSEDSNFLYASRNSPMNCELRIWEWKKNKVQKLQLPGYYGTHGFFLTPDGKNLFVGFSADLDFTLESQEFTLVQGKSSSWYLTGDDKTLYGTQRFRNEICVIDRATRVVINRIQVKGMPKGPYGIAISPKGNILAATSLENNVLNIINVSKKKVIQVIRLK